MTEVLTLDKVNKLALTMIPRLPDIGWIRNEPRYYVEVLNNKQTKGKLIRKKVTKREAVKVHYEAAERGIPVRVYHYGKTGEGVKMLMPDYSFRWKIRKCG